MAEVLPAPRASSRCSGPRRCPRTAGLAIPLVLLLILGLTALSHGVLLMALQDQAGSRASRALLQARLLAEGGVRLALRELEGDTVPLLGPGPLARGEVPDGLYTVKLRWLGRELLWVEGEGQAALVPSGPLVAHHRTARILWALSPLERVGAFRAVVEHGGGFLPFSQGSLDGTDAGDPGTLDAPRECHDRRAGLDSILPLGVLPAEARLPPGESLLLPRLGLLPLDTLAARLPGRAAPVVTPEPRFEDGLCLRERPDNWGSPADPAGPCGGYRPSISATGDLRVVGGEGQGLLLVPGNLTLEEGARYAGLVLVGGDLTLGPGSVLEGLAQVRGTVYLADGSSLRGRACPALLALEAALELRRPIVLPASGWVGPL